MSKCKFWILGFIYLVLLFSCADNTKKEETMDVVTDSLADTKVKNIITENADTVMPAKPELKTCSEIVFEILTTSDRYKSLTKNLTEAVIKNGGTSYGISLEGSPNPKQDSALAYSKTYDFNVHESYLDRQPVIARFTFDPIKKQLFEYNIAADSLIPIVFDKKLLVELNKVCK